MTRKQPKRTDRPGVDRYGRSELHYAAGKGDLERVVALLTQGADAGLPDDDGRSPLHFAAQAYSAPVAAALLDGGATIDAVDNHGNTPLQSAVFESRGRPDLILMLRSRGADPVRLNNHGVSALSLARTIANFDVAQFFTDLSG